MSIKHFMMKVNRPIFIFLLITSFIEGGALMAIEILGTKIFAPWYGTSIYVWTATIGATLGGLAIGYAIGGNILMDTRREDFLRLNYVVLLSAIIVLVIPISSSYIMNYTMHLSLKIGVTIASFMILSPPLICFGIVSPLIINIITNNNDDTGRMGGLIYAISTFSGIIFTLLFGLYIIPYLGVIFSINSIGISLLILSLFGLLFFSGKFEKFEK